LRSLKGRRALPAMGWDELIWNRLQEELRKKLSKASFDAWIAPLRARVEGDELVLFAANRFFLEGLIDRYGDEIQQILEKVAGRGVRVSYRVDPELAERIKTEEKPAQIGRADGFIDPRFSFETFVVGSGNEFCHAACRAVSQRPGEAYNPLYIYGGVGLGKTHLLHAIANELLQTKPLLVAYRTGEQFTNELIDAIQSKSTDQFRERYRRVDVLIIDDIQFIAGKERTQEEFFHTFNALYAHRKQIVIASDRSPSKLENLTDRLRSRFNSGLVADIQPPDYETRLAILHSKAKIAGIRLPEDVARLLASRITSNVRELEGALTRLNAHANLTGSEITVELARRILRDLLHEPKRSITIEDIQRAVANHYGIAEREMRSGKRARSVAFPRQVAMYLAKELTRLSLPEIGRHFGGKDHTTVLYAVRKISKLKQEDESFAEELEGLIEHLRR